MDQEEKPAPTPSRTLRVPQNGYDDKKYDFASTLNGNVYFLTFDDIDSAVSAYQKLKDDKVPVRYHVYSLFVKFDETLSSEKLTEHINSILKETNKNVTYTRVDGSNHTGKVVVDRLDDCKNLLVYRDETTMRLRFYRFDPKKAIKRLEHPGDAKQFHQVRRTNARPDDSGFTKVEYKKRFSKFTDKKDTKVVV